MMSKAWKGAFISFFAMFICWFGLNIRNLEMIRFVTTIYSAVLFIDFLFTGIVLAIRETTSPYCAFAIVNFVLGIGTAVFSIYDIKTDTDEWFQGLVGILLLAFVIPFIIVLLFIDWIAWKKNNSIKSVPSD